MADARLKGLGRYVTVPSTWVGLCAAALAVLYGTATLERPPGTTGWFATIVLTVAVLAAWLGDRAEQRHLAPVNALGGAEQPTPAALRAAAAALLSFPDRAVGIALQYWLGATVSIALSYWLVPSVTAPVAFRLAMLGGLLAPLTAVVTHLFVVSRAREALQRVVALGLSAKDVLELAPTTRLQLRLRLLLFIAATTLTPTLLMSDLMIHRGTAVLERRSLVEGAAAASAEIEDWTARDGLAVAGASVLMLVMVVAAGWAGGTMLGQPLREMVKVADRVAQGDLATPALVQAEDEVWAASAAFTRLQLELTRTIAELSKAGLRIGSTTEQMSSTVGQQVNTSTHQTSALQQTSATTEELARSAAQIAQSASHVAQMAEETLKAAMGGQKSAEQFAQGMARMRRGNQAIADAVVKLNKRVQQIGRIAEFIDGIADKTDLLALNAELEGNKAGDVGRGFSLVAAEMRRLAETVMTSTREIAGLIDDVRDATNAAVMATEAGVKATDRGASHSQEVRAALARILEQASKTSDAVRAISMATLQQKGGTDQLADAMAEILTSTEVATEASRQLEVANRDLASLASDLKVAVTQFRVE